MGRSYAGVMTPQRVLFVAENAAPAFPPAVSGVQVQQALLPDSVLSADAVEAVRMAGATAFDLVVLPAEPAGMCYHELAAAIADTCRVAGMPVPAVWRLDARLLSPAEPAAGGEGAGPATGVGVVEPPAAAEPERGSAAEPGAVAAIDLATLAVLESDIGDRSFVLDTVEVYLTELPDRVTAISDGIAAGAWADVKAVAHSLKSSSAMLGALTLAELCADLEHLAAADGAGADATELQDRLTREASATDAGLRLYMAD